MRLLLDACLPRKLKFHIPGHETWTAREKGWNALKDGELFAAMAGEIEVFITMDKGIGFQQQLQRRPFGVILLRAQSNRFPDLLPLMPEVLNALCVIKPGELVEVHKA